MVADLFTSIRDYLVARFSSPLLGAFAVAWGIVNYRIFFILLSNEPVMRRFALVEAVVFPDERSVWIYGVGYPLALALAYVLLYPFIARGVYWYDRWQQKRSITLQQRLDDETPLSEEKIRAFNREGREREKQHQQLVDDLQITIVNLRRELQESEQRVRDLESGPKPMIDAEDPGREIREQRDAMISKVLDGEPYPLARTNPSESIQLSWRGVLAGLAVAAATMGIAYPPDKAYLIAGVLMRRGFLSTQDASDVERLQEIADSIGTGWIP